MTPCLRDSPEAWPVFPVQTGHSALPGTVIKWEMFKGNDRGRGLCPVWVPNAGLLHQMKHIGGVKQTRLIHHDPKWTDCRMQARKAAVRKQYPNVRFGRVGEEVL